jgi:hypothetical protein
MGNKTGGGNNSSKQRKRRDDDMDVDTVKTTRGKGKGIPKDKRDRLQSEGKCFHCEKKYEPGHMCPKKKEAQKTYNKRNRPTRSIRNSNNDQLVAKLQKELATLQK